MISSKLDSRTICTPLTVEIQPQTQQDQLSELSSAPLSEVEVEPETTATAARSKRAQAVKAKRSYNTVDPEKRQQLIQMVYSEQKTIKEAANRLRINYSTAKHIIKSNKTEELREADSMPPVLTGSRLPLATKQPAPVDI